MSARSTTRWVGAALIIVGGLLGLYGLVLTGYAPLTAAWWGFKFSVFWGGIAALIVGIGAVFTAQYYMREERPIEERKKMEIQP
ncbi:MAG: hypothetical protein JRN52_04395 [Nitrososphaerota archaeon]|nr:hypothetical protein [Nitrososphaerota archaeon]